MKKVLLVTEMFPPRVGGAENYYFKLCSNLPSEKISVLANKDLLKHGNPAKEKFQVEYVDFFIDSKYVWPKSIKLVNSLNEAIKTQQPDILWAGEVIPAGIATKLVAKMHSLPYIVSTHGADVLNPQIRRGMSSRRRLWLMKKVLRDAHLILANSEYTRLILSKLGVSRDKSIVVYPSPTILPKTKSNQKTEKLKNLRTIKELKQNGYKIVLTVARQEKRKGVDMVLQAMTKVWLDLPKVAYVVVGDGPYLAKLKAISKKVDHFVDNRPRIYFTGQIDNNLVSSIYSLADVFIMTPREEGGLIEGFGTTYLEAGSHNLPVIGSKVGGVPEAVIELYENNFDKATGLLVDNPQNSKEIAKKILMLLKDKGLAKKLGANGKVRAEKFSWANEAKKLEKFLSF
jgi:phosphatidyl-myo-inositol dimannoside synthase